MKYQEFCKAYSAKHIAVLEALIDQVKKCTNDEFGYLSDVICPEGMSKKTLQSFIENMVEAGHIKMTGVEDGYKILIDNLPGQTQKEKEICILNQLFDMDGYFKDEFNGKKEQMISNIRNDYPLLYGTELVGASEVKTLRGQLEERSNEIEDLHQQKDKMIDFLIDRAQAFSDSMLLEKASEMCGMKEVIRRKIVKGFPLWEFEKDWLLQNLF